MAQALRTAALVVGAAALVATGIGAAAGATLIGTTLASGAAGFAGIAASTFTAVGAIAGAVGGVLSLAAVAVTPKGSVGGNATKFKIDKDAGIPYHIGRSLNGGNVVHRQYYGSKNDRESWVTVRSLGPVKSLGAFLVDKAAVAFATGAAVGAFNGYMWLDEQVGACPETRALAGPSGPFPGWQNNPMLSGLAADLWTLRFDTKGKKYPNGTPQSGRVMEGVFVYDMRQDGSIPGGSGACRIGQESTYVYNDNPACHAVTWAFGRVQNGQLVAGGGMKVSGIDLAAAAEWASVCDVNKWTVGGVVWTNTDNTWDVLKMICQAGGAEPIVVGGMLSFTFNAPRVSIGTITSADVAGDVDAPSSSSRRTRRNTVIPRVRLESHGWEVVPLDALTIADYVAVDGGKRPTEIEFPLVQDADQGAQLGVYALMNGRELDGITIPAKVYAIGYRPGDCITLDIPEANLIGRQVIIRSRELSGSDLGVTLTCRTETAGKHAFALGRTGTPPRTPDLSILPPDTAAPLAADWSATGSALSQGGASLPAVVVTGAATNPNADAVIFDYRVSGTDGWASAGVEAIDATRKEITSVASGATYDVAISYRIRGLITDRLVLGPVTVGALTVVTLEQLIIANSYPVNISIIAKDDGGSASVTISAHSRIYQDRTVSVNAATITGLQNSTSYYLYYDDAARAGGAVQAMATTVFADGFTSSTNPARHPLGSITTPAPGGADSGGSGSTPPGGGGGEVNPNVVEQ